MYYVNKFIDRCASDHVDKTDNFGGNANNGHKHNIKPTRYVTILYYIALNSYLQYSHLGFKVISKESTVPLFVDIITDTNVQKKKTKRKKG